MKENQVYKWFWEIRQKQKEFNGLESDLEDISEFTLVQKFEIFINKDKKQYRKQLKLVGSNLSGRELTQEEMIASVKLYLQTTERGEETLSIAGEIKFDVEKVARVAFDVNEPF